MGMLRGGVLRVAIGIVWMAAGVVVGVVTALRGAGSGPRRTGPGNRHHRNTVEGLTVTVI